LLATCLPNPQLTIIFSILGVTLLAATIYLYFQNQQLKKQFVNQQISPTVQVPSPIPQSISPTQKTVSSISLPPDETAGWKTYLDQGRKFSIKYPATYKFVPKETNANYVTIRKPGGEVDGTDSFSHFRITIEENISLSIEDAIIETQNDSKNIFGNDIIFTPTKPIYLGKVQGQSYYHSEYGYQQHVFITDKNSSMIIHFSIIFANQEVQKQEQSEVDQILSTFRFADEN